jgi:hypothetical protein
MRPLARRSRAVTIVATYLAAIIFGYIVGLATVAAVPATGYLAAAGFLAMSIRAAYTPLTSVRTLAFAAGIAISTFIGACRLSGNSSTCHETSFHITAAVLHGWRRLLRRTEDPAASGRTGLKPVAVAKGSIIRGRWRSCQTADVVASARDTCECDRTGVIGAPLTGVPPVFKQEEGGLLDVALDPVFARAR